jgi:multiple sugar transport system permease protein
MSPPLPKKSSFPRRDILTGYLFLSPWLLGLIFFTAGPVLLSFYMSFTSWTLLTPPRWVGLDNYSRLFAHDPLFYQSLYNTVYYVVLSVPLSMVAALALALLVNKKIQGVEVFRTIFYLPSVTNMVAVSVLWLWIFNPEFGLLNSVLRVFGIDGPLWLQSETWSKPSLILMGLWSVGGGMIIYLAGLQGIPHHLYEAAELDGASAWGKFKSITLPMLTPAVFFNLVMNIIGSFQVFTQAYVMTSSKIPGSEGGPANSTLFYVLYLYKKAFQQFKMGDAAAMAWILFLVIFSLTVIQFRLSRRWVYYEAGEKN